MRNIQPLPLVQRVVDPERHGEIEFVDGRATIFVPAYALNAMPFEVDDVTAQPDYMRYLADVRSNGYCNSRPIKARISNSGTWLIDESDAVRFTAAKQVAKEYLPNVLHSKVVGVTFVLTNRSRIGHNHRVLQHSLALQALLAGRTKLPARHHYH